MQISRNPGSIVLGWGPGIYRDSILGTQPHLEGHCMKIEHAAREGSRVAIILSRMLVRAYLDLTLLYSCIEQRAVSKEK